MKTLWCVCVLALGACLLQDGQFSFVGFDTELDRETCETLEGASLALKKCDSSDHRKVECEPISDQYECNQTYQKSEALQEYLDELSWGTIRTCTHNGCKNTTDKVFKTHNCLSRVR